MHCGFELIKSLTTRVLYSIGEIGSLRCQCNGVTLQSSEYLLLAVNNAPPPKPVVIKMTQRE